MREDFSHEVMIWRCIKEGMCTMQEIKNGAVTLRDIGRMSAYLDMVTDIELKAQQDAYKNRG